MKTTAALTRTAAAQGARRKRFRKALPLMILSLPAVISIFVFCYMPMFGLFIAFKDINYGKGIFGSDWSGLSNFKFFFTSQDAFRVTRNTILYNLVFIVVGLGLAIVIAMVLYELSAKFVKVFQTVLFIPYFLSWVVVGFVSYIFLNPSAGLLNQILTACGVDPMNWYANKSAWPFIIPLFYLWKTVGYNAIIFYTGLMGIDHSMLEAAELDAATKFQQRIYVILPMIRSLIIIMTVLAVGKIMFADFGLFYFIPRDTGMIYSVTDVIDTYVYRALRVTGDIGMSAAVTFYQSVVGFLLVMITNFIIRKISPEDALF